MVILMVVAEGMKMLVLTVIKGGCDVVNDHGKAMAIPRTVWLW